MRNPHSKSVESKEGGKAVKASETLKSNGPPSYGGGTDLMHMAVVPNDVHKEPMSIRILVVDDHPLIRQGLRVLLEAHADWQVASVNLNWPLLIF